MAGNDVLIGGKGKDVFVFATALNKATNLDKITDFNVKDDSIQLEQQHLQEDRQGHAREAGQTQQRLLRPQQGEG